MIKLNISRPPVTPLIVACALFMEHLDSTIISAALPTIAHALQTSPLHLGTAIASYMLGLAMFIPLSGWMADRFGARNVFCAAIVVFTLSSLFCGLAWDLTSLVAARLLQGVGAAMMTPVGRLVLLRSVPRARLVNAMSWMSVPALIGPLLGPPLGGLIVTYTSWRWIFLVNLPIGMLGFFLARLHIANVKERNPDRFDLPGFAMIGLAMAALVSGCETLGRHEVPFEVTVALLAASFLLFALYLLHIRKVREPLIDPLMLKNGAFRASVTGGFLFRLATGAMPLLLPVMLQNGFGMTPADSGWLMLAGAIGAIPSKIAAQPILRRFGFRRVLLVDATLCALFFAAYAGFSRDTPTWLIFAALMFGGVCRSLMFTLLNTVAFADMPQRLLSRSNTFYTTQQQLSLSLGAALAALTVEMTLGYHGHETPSANDFGLPFLALAALTFLSAIPYFGLSQHTGSDMSGHANASKSLKIAEATTDEQG